jgi:hypothetical protein
MVGKTRVSLCIAASLMTIGTFGTTGCFLRNLVVYPPAADSVSGFYATQPQSVSYTEVQNGTAATQNGSVNAVPSYAASLFVNPLTVQLASAGASTGYIFPYLNQNLAQPIDFNAANKAVTITNTAVTSVIDAWGSSSACQLATVLNVNGTLTSLGSTSPYTNINGTPVTLLGRFSGTVTVALWIIDSTGASTAACTAALANISSCYSNVNNCGATGGALTDNQTILSGYQSLFGTWVDDAHVITAADIGDLTPDLQHSLSYQVQYE